MLMAELNVDTAQVADLVVRTQAAANKLNNGIDFLEEAFKKVQAESEQSTNAKAEYLHVVNQTREVIIPKMRHCAAVAEEFKQQIIELEGNDQLFSEATASRSEAEAATRSRLKG